MPESTDEEQIDDMKRNVRATINANIPSAMLSDDELAEINANGERLRKYNPSDTAGQQLIRSFTYHAPVPDQYPRFEEIRRRALVFGALIQVATPPCREQSLALTKLEEVVMWANAAIARNEK